MRSKIVKVLASVMLTVGLAFGATGAVAMNFISNEAVVENIYTGDDASIPEQLVNGPFTMKAQADNILHHTLARTDGLRYAEMDREDENRPMWVTATTLRTALHFGILSYAFSLFVIVVGLLFMMSGAALWLTTKEDNPSHYIE